MRKPRSLADRASDYCCRTMEKHAERWLTVWVARAWVAGYRAAKRDLKAAAGVSKMECEIGGCDKPNCTVCRHWKKER